MTQPSGLRFECTQCGKCCTTRGEYAYVYLGKGETQALAELLELELAEFERRYTFIDEEGWRQLAFTEDRCVFLTDGGLCGVYEARPSQCRTFPFWPDMIRNGEWTAEAREMCEGLGRGRVWSVEEVRSNTREFVRSNRD